jgi:hypothetical protein
VLRNRLAAVVALIVVSATGCADSRSGGGGESIEYKLAAIGGDTSDEGEFSQILDQLQAGGGICEPEPDREHIADVLVGSWEQGGEVDSLLEYSRALASACG